MKPINIASMKIPVVPFWAILFGIINVSKSLTNGYGAKLGVFPYQVSIFYWESFGCGGGIIDATHVLTAAHCVDNYHASVIMVQAGSIDLNNSDVALRSVQSVHLHPNFTRWSYDSYTGGYIELSFSEDDIAVLTINEQFVWDYTIAAVPLSVRNFEEYYNVCTCYFAGWGNTDVLNESVTKNLQYMVMKILTPLDCLTDDIILNWNQFCAQDIFQQSITLDGDSGGPLVCEGELVGILNGGSSVPPYPSTFINVQTSLDFINEVLNN